MCSTHANKPSRVYDNVKWEHFPLNWREESLSQYQRWSTHTSICDDAVLHYFGDSVEIQSQVRTTENIQITTVCDCQGGV